MNKEVEEAIKEIDRAGYLKNDVGHTISLQLIPSWQTIKQHIKSHIPSKPKEAIHNEYTRALMKIDKGEGSRQDFELLMKLAEAQGDDSAT